MQSQKTQTIQVFIRVRRMLPNETQEIVKVSEDNRTLHIQDEFTQKFDYAFGQRSQQCEVFERVIPFLQQVPRGVNLTVFAYGQTGSGKTYTMFGSDWEIQENKMKQQATFYENLSIDTNNAGIIPRCIYRLFHLISKEYYVYCSFLQIYNEKIYDLLADQGRPLNIHESASEGIFVENLTEYAVNSYSDCLSLMQKGEKSRAIRSTSMNAKSSRSHSIFQIILEPFEGILSALIRERAKINLCDLAGSEKINKNEVMSQQHLLELKNINQSLTTLGKVIQTLSKKQKLPVPYRESKLTRLLQDSLGGNTQTILIAGVNPCFDSMDETYSTLKFAERAKNIVIRIKPNKINATDNALINKMQREIDYLKQLLSMKRNGINANDIYFKLLKLQEENDRLRQKAVEVNDVERLIEENRNLRLEIQKMQVAVTQFDESQQNEFLNLNSSFDKTQTQSSGELLRTKRTSSQHNTRNTLLSTGVMIYSSQQQPTLEVRIKTKSNQTQIIPIPKPPAVDARVQSQKREKDLKIQKRRVLERLEALERMHQQNNVRLNQQMSEMQTRQNLYQERQRKVAEDLINH